MANFKTQTRVVAEATITFNELELGALDALIGYGADNFLKVFYEKLGESYMRPYDKGLRSLFATLGTPCRRALHDAKEARRVLGEDERKRRVRAA